MKKTFLISVVLFLFLFSFNSFAGKKEEKKISKGKPTAYFSETQFNFGRIPPGSVVTHVFWVKNIGTDTLRIINVRPG